MTPLFKSFLMVCATVFALINVADAWVVTEPQPATEVTEAANL